MHFDIFNNDAFSLVSLTKAINDLPHTPGRLGQLGLFSEEPVATTSVSIEKQGTTLSLVQTKERGSPGSPVGNDKRNIRNFRLLHMPQDGAVVADEVQNLRAFGAENEVETVQNLVMRKFAKMKRNTDATIEYQRMGAVKGLILDADGTPLLDLFQEFGVTQSVFDCGLDSDTTKVKQKFVDLNRRVEDELGGLQFTGLRVLCSSEFFDALTSHPAVEAAFDRYMDGAFLREDQRKNGFMFADTYFEEYRGKVGSTRFIAAGEAYAVPEGVPDLFVTHFGPADYLETVNTLGLPYYARQYLAPNGKRVELESQSNPLSLCTRPKAVFKLTI